MLMVHSLSRRHLLGALLAGSASACSPQPHIQNYQAQRQITNGRFAHGVASGDPLSDRVIIWTRLTPLSPNDGPATIGWEVAMDEDFNTIIQSGQVTTQAARHWTVKVDVSELKPGLRYFYRFYTDSHRSAIGQTRTLPEGKVESLHFAIVSCANWQHGFFNVYDLIARNHDAAPFDALLHLGDYIYEYGADQVLGSELAEMGRLHEPRHEIITLDDYRTRHAQYRLDPNLQAVTHRMPMIAIWDDHESANDSWQNGAENHDPAQEGNWSDRKAAALQAYYEWMPIRDPVAGKTREHLYRSFSWGDLATITAVETRLLARDEPLIIDDYYDMIRSEGGAETFKNDILNDPNRNMLGTAQRDFITQTFRQSKQAGQPWRILANQVVMGRVMTPDLTPHVDEASIKAIAAEWPGVREFVDLSRFGLPVYPDSWDGYPHARDMLYASLKTADITDMLVLTGDAHEFWVNNLTDKTGDLIGIELGTSSVSSETLANFMGDATADYALLMTQSNPDVRYYNALYRGYIDLTLKTDRAIASLMAVDTVTQTSYAAFETARFTVRHSRSSLKLTAPKGLNLKQRALFNGLG